MQHSNEDSAARYVIPDEVDSKEWAARRELASSLRALEALCVISDADADAIELLLRVAYTAPL